MFYNGFIAATGFCKYSMHQISLMRWHPRTQNGKSCSKTIHAVTTYAVAETTINGQSILTQRKSIHATCIVKSNSVQMLMIYYFA